MQNISDCSFNQFYAILIIKDKTNPSDTKNVICLEIIN